MPALDAYLGYWNRSEVGRRALVQILALRSWQVRHDGRLPERLSELVPSELESLPQDPYKLNSTYGYVRSDWQSLLPLGEFDPVRPESTAHRPRPTENCRLLYGVGPDLQDDRASMNDSAITGLGDIVFPLPERIGGQAPKGGDTAKKR
jgi:hypothetical protein